MAAARARRFPLPTEEQSATLVPEITLTKKRGHQNGVWKVRGVLRKSTGENVAERRKGSETLQDGSAVDINEKPLPPFSTARDTGSFFKRDISGRKLRREYDNRGIPEHAEPRDRLPRRPSVWFYSVQRRPDREGSRTLYRSSGKTLRHNLEMGDCTEGEGIWEIRKYQSNTIDVQITLLLATCS